MSRNRRNVVANRPFAVVFQRFFKALPGVSLVEFLALRVAFQKIFATIPCSPIPAALLLRKCFSHKQSFMGDGRFTTSPITTFLKSVNAASPCKL